MHACADRYIKCVSAPFNSGPRLSANFASQLLRLCTAQLTCLVLIYLAAYMVAYVTPPDKEGAGPSVFSDPSEWAPVNERGRQYLKHLGCLIEDFKVTD